MDSSAVTEPADHIARNELWWERRADGYQHVHERELPTEFAMWSLFSIPNSELDVLPKALAGLDVVELGAGGAQFSLGLAREGAKCTAVDFSPEQLVHAERLIESVTVQDGARPDVTLVNADVEDTKLPAASFDIAVSDYGASMFADPRRWVPEAARLLRSGGRLAFSSITPIHELCWPDRGVMTNELVKPYFGMHRVDWDGASLFNLTYGEWIRLFRSSGFTIVDMVETQPRAGVTETTYRSANQVEWARQWPAEMIWVLDRD